MVAQIVDHEAVGGKGSEDPCCVIERKRDGVVMVIRAPSKKRDGGMSFLIN